MGLILSVQESGVIELWAERGAPQQVEGNHFNETSVCLIRLDLGEEAARPPFGWKNQVLVPGSSSLSSLEFHSSPSVSHRTDIAQLGNLHSFLGLDQGVLIWGDKGSALYESPTQFRCLDLPPLRPGMQLSDGHQVLRVQDDDKKSFLLDPDFTVKELGETGLEQAAEYGLWADRFLLFSGKTLSYLDGESFVTKELPATIVSQPLYLANDKRLLLLLNDGSIRTCSTEGDKFSFRCEMAGTPTTWPLVLGNKVFYGTEGRYLCCDEEAIRPRLGSTPMGRLSYANSRVYGTSQDGSMFCFAL